MRELGHALESAVAPIRQAAEMAVDIAQACGAKPDSPITAKLFDALLPELLYASAPRSDDW